MEESKLSQNCGYRYSSGQINLLDFKQSVGMNLKESNWFEPDIGRINTVKCKFTER